MDVTFRVGIAASSEALNGTYLPIEALDILSTNLFVSPSSYTFL